VRRALFDWLRKVAARAGWQVQSKILSAAHRDLVARGRDGLGFAVAVEVDERVAGRAVEVAVLVEVGELRERDRVDGREDAGTELVYRVEEHVAGQESEAGVAVVAEVRDGRRDEVRGDEAGVRPVRPRYQESSRRFPCPLLDASDIDVAAYSRWLARRRYSTTRCIVGLVIGLVPGLASSNPFAPA
jgi:hypothetical protein